MISRFGIIINWLFPLFSSIVRFGYRGRVAKSLESYNVRSSHITSQSSRSLWLLGRLAPPAAPYFERYIKKELGNG